MGIFKIAEDQQVPKSHGPVIKVSGIGGGGSNAVEHMVISHLQGVEFICANTDMQALSKMSASGVVQLGADLTRGLGAGTNPEVGRQAALETREQIIESLKARIWYLSPQGWVVVLGQVQHLLLPKLLVN